MIPARHIRHLAQTCAALLSFATASLGPGAAAARDLFDSTYLVDIRHGTRLSEEVSRLGRGGFELSGGSYLDLKRWYAQKWTEMRADFMTQVSEDIGILWGLSTGEWGAKYRIDPGFKVGLILQRRLTPSSALSVSFTTILGGRLREKTCVADYGEIGGVQEVNCRLAASTLAPSDTLKYVVNMKPPDHTWIGLRYQARF